MPKAIIILLLFLLQQNILSQPSVKQPSLTIPDNLTYTTSGISSFIKEHLATDTARIRAIFVWVANNISYDIVRFQNKTPGIQPVADVLKTRLAVCRGYADLFSELCNQCNISSMVIGGYTRQKGIVSSIPHAWVAAELDHKWYFFDPTWASGYVEGNKFTKSYSSTYYKLTSDMMLNDHMPFDPLYQLSEHTISNKDFIEGRTTNTNSPVFNFTDTLQKFNLLSREDKTRSELRRIQSIGIENDAIKGQIDYLNKLTESYSSKSNYEQAMDIYKHSIALFNEYIAHKNKQFTSIEGKDIKVMVDSISYHVNASWNLLVTAVARDDANRRALSMAFRDLEKFQNVVNREKAFVTTYLSSDMASRNKLFYQQNSRD